MVVFQELRGRTWCGCELVFWHPNAVSNDKDLATALQFGSSIGVLHRLRSTRWLIGVRLTHYSNAGIKQPNPGQDYFQLWTSYVFP